MDRTQSQPGWRCPACGVQRGEDRTDPCLGTLPGVEYACCGHGGHGDTPGYLYFTNGVRLGVVISEVTRDKKGGGFEFTYPYQGGVAPRPAPQNLPSGPVLIAGHHARLAEAVEARTLEWDRRGVMDASFLANAMAGEAGELLEEVLNLVKHALLASNRVKKLERERLGLPGSRETVEAAMKELADVVIYAYGLADKIGGDLDYHAAVKFNETSAKMGLKTTAAVPLDRKPPVEF